MWLSMDALGKSVVTAQLLCLQFSHLKFKCLPKINCLGNQEVRRRRKKKKKDEAPCHMNTYYTGPGAIDYKLLLKVVKILFKIITIKHCEGMIWSLSKKNSRLLT